VVIAGSAWLDVDGVDDPIYLQTGDVAVLPGGDGHRVRDSPTSPAPLLASILAGHDLVDGELRFGGDEAATTEIVCGVFMVEGGPPPWFDRLRRAVVSSASSPRSDWRGAVAAAVREEVRAPTPGGTAVVSRWLESILIDALRHELLAASPGSLHILALSDERIGRVLAQVHERPGQPWTLGSLAEVATMSRSTFAARFRSVVHEPPGRYVTRVRLEKAERLLHATDSRWRRSPLTSATCPRRP
jgi:AraC-like DNA-binding protein